jgi:hypothetical protein
MAGASLCEGGFRADSAGRIGLDGIVGRDDFLSQPPFEHGISFLQSTQTRPDHFRACGVGTKVAASSQAGG